MSPFTQSLMLPVLILATLLLGLTCIACIDPYLRRDRRRILLSVAALVFSLLIQNLVEHDLAQLPMLHPLRLPVSIYGYAARPVVLALLFQLVDPKARDARLAWALVIANALVHLTALFSPLCFSYSPNNRFYRGPLGFTCHIVSAVLLVWLLIKSLEAFRRAPRSEALIPVFSAVLIALSVVADTFIYNKNFAVSYLNGAMVVSAVFFYMWLHLRFVREHERALREEQRVQLMLSQIKPHFLYNALGTIEDLCASVPEAARSATVMFAQYLRGNMDALDREGTIWFERELEHTRLYLELEKLRFEEALAVRYDIGCTDFSLPPLTLEPLAENAVRHGVRGNPDGRGAVVIASREYPDRYEVTVQDDGPGFDPKSVGGDGKPHVGLKNVGDRLAHIGGALRIDSRPGEGTIATIVLPK